MLLDVQDSQLLLIDYQTRLMPAIFEGPQVVANAVRLARVAALLKVPVWATEENPEGLGGTAPELLSHIEAARGRVLPKMQFSAVADGLAEVLRPAAKPAQAGNARSLPKHLQKPAQAAPQRSTIVIAGCESHVCMMQTALDLLDEEFDVVVVTDASSSRTERNRDAAFDRLAGAGAELVTTEMVAFEWLRGADHPQFKAVLDIVR
jgi:nicotinamidase-related amidase